MAEVALPYLLHCMAVWYHIHSKTADFWRFQLQVAAVNIIFWCWARFNGLQRYSHSSGWSHNFKAVCIDRIVTLEWQTIVGDGDWPG